MADRPDGKAARTEKVTFTRPAAERIASVVRRVEQGNRDCGPLTFERVGIAGGGGATIRIGKTTCDWSVGQCVPVTLWGGAGTCTPTQTSPLATVENVRNLSHDVAQDSWVAIGKAADGKWYLVEAGSPDDSESCRKTIGGEDFTKWSGWNGSAVQLLGHDANGCLKWYDVNACETPSP
jgi:hypothetical protein